MHPRQWGSHCDQTLCSLLGVSTLNGNSSDVQANLTRQFGTSMKMTGRLGRHMHLFWIGSTVGAGLPKKLLPAAILSNIRAAPRRSLNTADFSFGSRVDGAL